MPSMMPRVGAVAPAAQPPAGDARSPYLLQHADEAFDEARRRDVPVLLSVGYAACHWCHEVAA